MVNYNKEARDLLRKTGVICIISFLLIALANAQTRNTTGVVVDGDSGEPLTGASITVKGCISDLNGKFTFHQALSEQQTLVVSYIGYQTIEIPVQHKMMEIRLRPNMNQLDEVVVQVAYGTAL